MNFQHRTQLSVLAAEAATAAANGRRIDYSFDLMAVRSGTNDIAFRAFVRLEEVDQASGESFNTFSVPVADDAGKARTFRDADDFLKQAGALGMVTDTPQVRFGNMALVAPKAFTGNVITKNEALVQTYTKRKATAVEKSDTLATEIALMAGDMTVPQATKNERAEQKGSVDALISWLTAEITRINGLLGV